MSDLGTIYQLAKKHGFSLVKVAQATKLTTDKTAYLKWLKENKHGEMSYLARDPKRRYDPQEVLPGAKSIIMVALNYYQKQDTSGTRIARYAANKADYHNIFELKLKRLQNELQLAFKDIDAKFYVDYGPLMERPYAAQSSMGFIGKNTLLITKPFGSWVLLGEIITTLNIGSEAPEQHGSCGSCTRCISVCPTGAIKENYVLDSNLCISYLTIEYRGSIPMHLRKKIGTWLFGCDLCQEICPHNSRAQAYSPQEWHEVDIEADLANPEYLSSVAFLKRILDIKDDIAFRTLFKNTPFLRAKREGLIRNACIVAGNLGKTELMESLLRLSNDPSPLIREHAEWAITELSNNANTEKIAD